MPALIGTNSVPTFATRRHARREDPRPDRASTGGCAGKPEGVTEILAVVAVERIGEIIHCKLRAESDVDAVAVRQITDVTAHWKDARRSPRALLRCIARIFQPRTRSHNFLASYRA
jgi:hypothetical protein